MVSCSVYQWDVVFKGAPLVGPLKWVCQWLLGHNQGTYALDGHVRQFMGPTWVGSYL